MRRNITALAIIVVMVTASFAQTKKDSTGNKKFNTNRTATKYKPTATTNGGKPDMRYKMHKKN